MTHTQPTDQSGIEPHGAPVHIFMERALALAVASASNGGGPFGAVVVRNGGIIAEGVNGVTSAMDPTAHAEVTAIRGACSLLGSHQLTGCDIYTSCEPCPMCLGAMYWARPDRVFYSATAAAAAAAGFDDAFIYAEMAAAHHERQIPLLPLLEGEGEAPFAAWRKNLARVAY